MKGIFTTYLLRARFIRSHCYDTGASGLGVDHLVDSSSFSCIVERARRNATTSSPGCSGFGIGTGPRLEENLAFIDCLARDCKRYGFFLERQQSATLVSQHTKFVGCHAQGIYRGFGDNGTQFTIFDGGSAKGNIADGFAVMADQTNLVGYDGILDGCISVGNGNNGILFDYSSSAAVPGHYTVTGFRIKTQRKHGHQMRYQHHHRTAEIYSCGHQR